MIGEFIYKYYIDPIRYGHPYNVVDTLTYAFLLLVSAYLVYRWLQRRGIPLDNALVIYTLPYVIFGGLLRVVEDADIINSDLRYLLITPIIFFVVFFIAAAVLFASTALRSKGYLDDYKGLYGGVGIACICLCIVILAGHAIRSGEVGVREFFAIPVLAFITSLGLWVMLRYGFGWQYLSSTLYKILIFGHMLDASATAYGIDLHEIPYREVHVVGSALISLTGTGFSMYLLKLIVLIPAIYVLERSRYEVGEGIYHIAILVMILLGLAPGIRDMTRMILYV